MNYIDKSKYPNWCDKSLQELEDLVLKQWSDRRVAEMRGSFTLIKGGLNA